MDSSVSTYVFYTEHFFREVPIFPIFSIKSQISFQETSKEITAVKKSLISSKENLCLWIQIKAEYRQKKTTPEGIKGCQL